MKIIVLIFLMLFALLFLGSCYYDKEQVLYPGAGIGPCTDTATTVSYSKQVVPLLQQRCYGCHGGSFPSGNISMGNYAADKSVAQSGKLYGSISYTPGYSPMPKGAAKMNSCQVASIKKWIDAGMPNN